MALDLKTKKDETKVETKATEAKVEATAPVAEAPVAKDQKYGQSRKDLAFVCSLGNPADEDRTTFTRPDGTKDKKVTPTIVGYRFKALKDMKVPDFGTNEGLKKDLMNYDKLDNFKDVKAGEEFDLTPFEAAFLLSSPEFNGGCEGGEKPVTCVYQFKGAVSKKGEAATVTAASQSPRVSIRAVTGSIKDFEIVPVLTCEKVQVNGVTRKKCEIIPGFEKWAPLAIKGTKKAGSKAGKASSVDPTTVANANAQKFLQFVKSKQGK